MRGRRIQNGTRRRPVLAAQGWRRLPRIARPGE